MNIYKEIYSALDFHLIYEDSSTGGKYIRMKRTVKIPDLLKTARDFSPDIITVQLVKRDYGLSLRLRWKNFQKTIYSDHWIMSYTKGKLDPEAYKIIMERTKNEMKEAIT